MILFIPLAYDSDQGDASALRILHAYCPEWTSTPGSIRVERFAEGVMNTLLKLTKGPCEPSVSENEPPAVLLRAYGSGSEILVDRDMEARTHSLLSQHGLAEPLLARFKNGLLYRHAPGRACTAQDLGREPVWRAVAAKLGEWHALLPLSGHNGGQKRNICTVLQQWIDALPVDTATSIEKKESLQGELEKTLAYLEQLQGEGDKNNFVFGHCDLLSANVIIPEDSAITQYELNHHISFIDYEFAMPCPAAFDLANHFCEWGGFECNYEMLPTRAVRRAFVEQYLQSYNLHLAKGSATASASVDSLLAEIDRYRGIPGLYWGLHALIETSISHVEFDWAAYAKLRLKGFWDWRGELDGTRANEGSEMPHREQRWAQDI